MTDLCFSSEAGQKNGPSRIFEVDAIRVMKDLIEDKQQKSGIVGSTVRTIP
jgi:hypothetical protein